MNQITRGAVATVAALLFATSAKADFSYNVSIDTSSLTNDAGVPFYLDFTLNDGSGTSDANNTATISGFSYTGTGAGVSGGAVRTGGATGDLNSGAVLNDSSFFNDLYQSFNTNTTAISFNVNLTGLDDAGIANDTLAVSILDKTTNPIATSDANNTLITFNMGSSPTVSHFFGTTQPVTATVTAVPEPSTYALLGLGALALVVLARRRQV